MIRLLTTNRWWIYQQERFPVFGYGLLVAGFSLAVLHSAALLRGAGQIPNIAVLLVGFFSALLCFVQLRIADEFKDYGDDLRYRPYRPVPRGLVRLPELAVLAGGAGVIQLVLALWLAPLLVVVLLVVWGYLALMTKEFFIASWLKAHPLAYLGSHMLILPLLAFYISACDWLVAGTTLSHSLTRHRIFICVSFAGPSRSHNSRIAM